MEKSIGDIINLIQHFKESMQSHLPVLEKEIDELIESNSTDTEKIMSYLDLLLSLINHGFGVSLFGKLLDYYKSLDEDGAMFYWYEYDKE